MNSKTTKSPTNSGKDNCPLITIVLIKSTAMRTSL